PIICGFNFRWSGGNSPYGPASKYHSTGTTARSVRDNPLFDGLLPISVVLDLDSSPPPRARSGPVRPITYILLTAPHDRPPVSVSNGGTMKHARFALVSISVCAVVFALAGCGSSVMNSSNQGQPGPPPTVSSTGLQVNGYAANRWLYVQFSEDMDPATINSKTITVADSSGVDIPGNV